MKSSRILNILLLLPGILLNCVHANDDELSVYGKVPSLNPSPFYQIEVRKVGSENWLDPFTLVTECTAEKYCNTTGVFTHLQHWSNSYINFEMKDGVDIEIKISKLVGEPISKAVVHPYEASKDCYIKNGKAHVIINNTGLFTVDINGQMDDQDTGRTPKKEGDKKPGHYEGPPIHTVTIFANPFLTNKPSLDDIRVYRVTPGAEVPSEGAWDILYFLPGIHDIGPSFQIHTNKTYYIPGNAIVYGTMNNGPIHGGGPGNEASHVLIYGHGTLSGDRLPHPNFADPPLPDGESWKYYPIYLHGNCKMIQI